MSTNNVGTKERYSEPAATKLTPKQLAFANLAMTFAKMLDDPKYAFRGEREGQGETAAFYRAAILYFSGEIMEQVKAKTKGVNLLDWATGQLGDTDGE